MMKWENWYMPILNDPLESRIVLSKAESTTLKRAAQILGQIRDKLEENFGEDGAYEILENQPWIHADMYLSESLGDTNSVSDKLIIKLPFSDKERE